MHLRLDPWAAEYNTAYFASGIASELDDQQIDITIEHADWQACNPNMPAPEKISWQHLLFSDGSRRIEARVLLEDTNKAHVAFGALGSYAIGVVDCCAKQPAQRAASYIDIQQELNIRSVQRLCLLSNGHTLDNFNIAPDFLHHFGALDYKVQACEESDADAVIRKLQDEMLEAERNLSSALLSHYDHALILRDGPHPRVDVRNQQGEKRGHDVVGYVKTIHHIRLSRQELEVVRNLSEGQRSPLFLVHDPRVPYFECFLRLRDPSPWLYSLAGMVRLQFFAGNTPEDYLEAAQLRADWLSLNLPRFASKQYQDPRAPQQLLPVRALEGELRRLMGHPQLIRQRIMCYLRQRNQAA